MNITRHITELIIFSFELVELRRIIFLIFTSLFVSYATLITTFTYSEIFL
jgi:hypothetical protein